MDLKIFTANIEDEARQQLRSLMEQDAFKDSKVRIMPDVHAGKGCVIGFTGDLGDKVIPNIVGLNIGCGMLCIELGKIGIDLEKLDKVIRKYVPCGMNVHDDYDSNTEGLLDLLVCKDQLKNKDNWLYRSMGTLGGGNHFIEIDENDKGCKYLVIHTGSRNIGKQVAQIYQEKAIKNCSYEEEYELKLKETIAELKASGRKQEIASAISNLKKEYDGKLKLPKDFCYLEGQDRTDYLFDMSVCGIFAQDNRHMIANNILSHMGIKAVGGFTTVHNYIESDGIVRKGAVSAQAGEKLLIPMNMRDGCIIAIGKGNKDWNCSAPHGAGRIMSRTEAKKRLSMDDYKDTMNGIYSSSVNNDTLDEAPMAYKPAQEIIECIGDTVEIEKIIKPIYNFKASE